MVAFTSRLLYFVFFMGPEKDGHITELDMLQCQLRANGNSTCAVRFNTTTANGGWKEHYRCEQLEVDWCVTRVMEPGYTYVGKSAVYHTPPYTYYHHVVSWELWEFIPILIEQGARISVKFTPALTPWSKIRMDFINVEKQTIYRAFFYESSPMDFMGTGGGVVNLAQIVHGSSTVPSGEMSTVTASFEQSAIFLYVNETLNIQYGYIEPPSNIRILQFVFFDSQGEISLVSYKAAYW